MDGTEGATDASQGGTDGKPAVDRHPGRTGQARQGPMDRKQVAAWASFDFANSVYPAVVQTAVFSVFYTTDVVGNETGLGNLWWGWALAISVIIVACSSPLLGAIADRSGVRKRFMLGFTGMCLLGVTLFSLLEPGMALRGLVFFVIANVGFEGALVFYNAYLPDIAPKERQGWVSGLGFGVGYVGSMVGLLMVYPWIDGYQDPVWFLTAAFFAVFAIPAFVILPADERTGVRFGEAARWGLTHFRTIAGEVLAETQLRRFLIAFFFYIDFILTVIAFAAPIATETFGFFPDQIVILFFVVQISALTGAFATARPTDRLGPKKVLTGTLLLWAAVAVAALLARSQTLFFGIAVVAGFGLGSAQAASRTLMSSLIPDGKEAEMFGFYAFCGKSSSIVGPLIFGYVAERTGGNQRIAIAVLTVLLVIGLVLLQRVEDPKAPARSTSTTAS